jgi:hypothetical protein
MGPVLGIRMTCAIRWSETSGVLVRKLAKSSRTASTQRGVETLRSPGRSHALAQQRALGANFIHRDFWGTEELIIRFHLKNGNFTTKAEVGWAL